MNNLTHFDKIEYAIGGIESTSVPVAFWKHFPIDDQNQKHSKQRMSFKTI